MKFVCMLLFAVALISPVAHAEPLDLESMTCDSLVKADKDQVKVIVAWLSGYHNDDGAPEVINLTALNSLQDKLVSFCNREGSFTVEAAAEGILGH